MVVGAGLGLGVGEEAAGEAAAGCVVGEGGLSLLRMIFSSRWGDVELKAMGSAACARAALTWALVAVG